MTGNAALSFSVMREIYDIAAQMEESGLPHSFIENAIFLAKNERGSYELFLLWLEAPTESDRDDVVADLQDRLDEVKDHPALLAEQGEEKPLKRPKFSFDSLEKIAKNIQAFKRDLRDKIEQRGMSLSELARRMDTPQSSVSRFFSSSAIPRRTTLYKIANAADLCEEDISEWS